MRFLRGLCESDPDYPQVVFVHLGTAAQGEAFFAKFWPEAAAVADPDRTLFQAFSLPRASLRNVLGLRSLAASVRALVRGNGVGKPIGDVWQMPGAFVLYHGRIVWSHRFEHVGDLPAYRRLPELLPRAIQPARPPVSGVLS